MPAPEKIADERPIESPRPLFVHLLPRSVDPATLAGGVAIVIDQLRASSTIAAALAAGAAWVEPVLNVEDAHAARRTGRDVVLGGERGGVRIQGFDLGNTPADYTAGRVGGKVVVFTTTNGTAALLHARQAAKVMVGCLGNLTAMLRALVGESRPVHIVCAGTHGEVSFDDCLAAGAIVAGLLKAGHTFANDAGLLCLRAYERASESPQGLLAGLRESLGGRNLIDVGLNADIEWCARVNTLNVVPVFDPASGRITGQKS